MWANLTNRITVTRRTAFAVAPAAVGSTLTLTRQPQRESLVEVETLGIDTGEATVLGTAAGVTTSETVRWVAIAGPRRTVSAFTAVAGITTSGFAGPTEVFARYLGRDGTPQPLDVEVVSDWPAQISIGEPSWPNSGPGRIEHGLARAMVAYAEHWEPREGDQFTDDLGQRWEVVGTPRPSGTTIADGWRCKVQRREAA